MRTPFTLLSLAIDSALNNFTRISLFYLSTFFPSSSWYPGGRLFNPLGIAKDIKNAHAWKLKEIKNGRLAMVAMLGIFVQPNVTHVGPIDNLIQHLSNPWHATVIQNLAGISAS